MNRGPIGRRNKPAGAGIKTRAAPDTATDGEGESMTRITQVLVPVALVLISLAMVAACQADGEVVVFSGELNKADAAAWGAGSGKVTDEQTYLERDVLEVDTKGFYEGARLHLKSPVPLTSYLTDPEKSFLVLIVKVHRAETTQADVLAGPGADMMPPDMMPGGPGGPPPGEPGGPGAMPPEAPGAMPPEPGMDVPPGGIPGQPEQPGQPPVEALPPMVTKLRALMVTDKGQLDSGAIDIYQAESALEEWYTMVIPLSRFAGDGKDAAARLQDIALFGDVEEKFWVATVKLVAESDPLVADAGAQRIVKAGKPVQFEAKPQTGAARPQYTWDFDDWDGISEDGIGQKVTWTFDEPGFYVVTLTVNDRTGRRLPQTARVDVKVEE